MLKILVSLVLPLVLLGCTSKESIPEPTHELKPFEVEWPKPLQPCSFDFHFEKVVNSDNVVVVIPYNSWISKSKCEEVTFTYISNLTAMICAYKANQTDKHCEMFNLSTNIRK